MKDAVNLEDLVPGVVVSGAVGPQPLDVVAVQWHGSNFVTLTYKDQVGETGQVVLGRDHEPRLHLNRAGQLSAFDGDAASWRLAAEALRIRYAALFDPIAAAAHV